MNIKETEIICKKVLKNNSKKIKEYKSGKVALIGLFTGQVMIESKGLADLRDIMIILKEQLK